MNSTAPPAKTRTALASWLVVLFLVAEICRVGAALWLAERNRRAGVEHDFPDSELYWKLALRVAAGEPYDDGRRQVLRTPGYPVFLAGSIRLFGPSITGARHAQAAIGSLSCVILFFLVRRLIGPRPAAVAAAIASVHPFAVLLSALLLSEALFAFAMLLQLLMLVCMVDEANRSGESSWPLFWAAATGLCGAAATLVRPSWVLATPLIAGCLAIRGPAGRGRSRGRFAFAFVVLVGFCLGMAPWWIRNWQVTGHFVSTTLWVGASLYDGLNDHATGASDMTFMEQPEKFGLDPALKTASEWEEDRMLRTAAFKFAREHPWRVVQLAWIKLIRFWNPLPNASGWGSPPMQLVSLVTCLPVFVLAVLGAWRLRTQWFVLAVLSGPVLYFCAIHLIFVSSIRYREAAMLTVLGMVAARLMPSDETQTEK